MFKIFGNSHKQNSKFTSGFTIVELLIVIVVIAILATITVVSYNGITAKSRAAAKESEITSWKSKSDVRKQQKNITCPENYSFVYGNSVLGTDDFCIMKYEAKNVGGIATSSPNGLPWVSINHDTANSAAQAVGGRLLTDAEWMTIAADVTTVKYNWSGGEVGSGYVFQGHVNNNPGSTIAASSDDTNSLFGMTGGFGTTVGTNSSRVLYLSSGDTIWDFVGNAYELTNQSLVSSQIGRSSDPAFAWIEYTDSALSFGNLPTTSRPSSLATYVNPITGASLSSIAGWDFAEGMGRINAHYADTSNRSFLRSGNYTGWGAAGPFTLVMNHPYGSTSASASFRVAI